LDLRLLLQVKMKKKNDFDTQINNKNLNAKKHHIYTIICQ
jgi:hypothetical protein